MRRIIVEGVDGSGKTTLIKALAEDFPLTVIRNDREDKQDFNTWWPKALRHLPSTTEFPVHDRFFYSELVYGPVIRGKINATPETIFTISKRLSSEALLIYCRPPYDVILANLGQHPQMEGVKENLEKLIDKYDELMTKVASEYRDRFWMHNYTDPTSAPFVTHLVEDYLLAKV